MPSQKELFLSHVGQTSDSPMMFEVESASGIYITSPSGQKNIDLISGIGPALLGHSHPHVSKAIVDQVKLYTHTMVYGEYVQSPQVQLATKLQEFLPDRLDSIFMVNSGAEAVEGAMKLARKYTGRYQFVALKHSYHGSTQGSAALMSDPTFTQAYRPLQGGIRFIERERMDELAMITEDTAAVIMETIKGEEGVRVLSRDYLQAVRKRCDEVGALLILDEIQCGYGRSGKMWAYEHMGIEPDILLTAKAFGGGMPLGAFIAPCEMMNVLSRKPILGHLTTFGGHPVSCAAALAVLEVLEQENIIADIERKGQRYRDGLVHPAISDVRGMGLMLAVELPSFDFVLKVTDYLMKNGILTDWFLFDERSIRVYPPLIITDEEIDASIELLLEAVGVVAGE